jgi:hypothetical protein
MLPFMPRFKMLAPLLARKSLFASEKARRVLGLLLRPATTTVVDCAESLPSGEWGRDSLVLRTQTPPSVVCFAGDI